MNAAVMPMSRPTKISLWVLRVLLAALFLAAAFMKLTGAPMLVAEFDQVGLGQGFRYLTGALELAGAVLLLAPPVSRYGAILLLLIDVGAFVAQVERIHMDWVHTVVIGALLVLAIYLQRPAVTERIDPTRSS
jgi:uncharacterized membrane protein YphA (DoxX/SURF4 family)